MEDYEQQLNECEERIIALTKENEELKEEIEDLEGEACKVDDIVYENTQLKARVKELEDGIIRQIGYTNSNSFISALSNLRKLITNP